MDMSRLGWTAIAICWLVSQSAVQAATITVSGEDPRRDITLTVENATVNLVLEDLHKRYGFEVGGLQNTDNGEAQSITMSGSLQSILERLLRNWNHMIVRSTDNESGIAKVMILNSTYGAAPSSPARGHLRGNENDRLMQALTGEGID
jgi:hypothetical protein